MTAAAAAIEGESLVATAMRSVREHIRSNGLRVGDALPGEHHFAGQLQVSRAVMREAFGALAALRLIDVANGRRARVGAIDGSVMATSLDHALATAQVSVPEIWDVRRTLEVRTARLAATNRSTAEAEQIVALARALGEAETLDEIVTVDVAFHQAIAKATHNMLFQQIVRSFEELMRVAVPVAWRTRTTEEQRRRVLENHHAIAAAIAAAEPEQAARAMDNHFDEAVIQAARDAR